MPPKISVFANVNPASFKGHFTVEDVLKTVRSEKFKAPTNFLRSLADAEAAKVYKAGKQDEQGRLVEPGHFYGVTWSGTFEGGKKASNLVEHSCALCVDVDGLTPERVAILSQQLRADEYTHVLFVSPSGNGLKWVVRVDLKNLEEHTSFFYQLSDYLHDSYGLMRKQDVPKGTKPEIDPSGKNVDRLCFLPHDPEAYHNSDSSIMPLLEEYRYQKQSQPDNSQPERYGPQEGVEDKTRRLISDCISQLQSRRIDLTDSYESWVEIGFAFASMGDEGRIYFHQVSYLNASYNYQQTDAKFTELLKTRSGSITIGTFFLRCEQAMGRTWDESRGEKTSGKKNQFPTDWSAPKPLTTTLLSVLSVSHSMLPEPLRPWLIDIANRMRCPLDFVASAAIVMISSLIGTRLAIRPKTRNDWTITINLWGAAIGDPSTMKTPSIGEVYKPLNRLVVDARKQYEDALKQYEAQQVTYEVQRKVYHSQEQERMKGKVVANPLGFPDVPQKPTERRYMTNDATVEMLANLLNENPTGLLQFRDELTGLLAGWERQGREEDRAFYLEAWNGSGSKTVDRIGRGTIHVKYLCVALFGGIQPSKLLPYLIAANGYDNDGFVQRLQVAVYPDRTPWKYIDEYPDGRARDQAYQLIKRIADSDFSSIAYQADEYNRFPYTRFDENAQEVFKHWLIHWETQVLPHESGLLLEHFAKYRSLIPSLALIFHVINCLGETLQTIPTQKQLVSAEAIQMAIEWCNYLQSHARRIYGLLDTQSVESAKSLLAHLKAGHLKNGFKVSDVQRKGWANLTKIEMIEAAIAELVDCQWIKEIPPPVISAKGGRPEAPHYLIHPTIIQNT